MCRIQVPSGKMNNREVDINFENVCRLHPRVLRIASRSSATKYHVNTDVLCRMNNTQTRENSNETQEEGTASEKKPKNVTYLNFYMYIFPGGEVFLDFRVYLKPTAAEIVLCKYPHDNPACSLKITS
ncbi:hypothetical protein OSTOST_13300, partial [Ostertagia ostertagi]